MDQKHFVLVHGVCHGGWCWYKLKPRLEFAGHKVTALDLAASGINTKKIEDVDTFYEYSKHLLEFMASLAPNEKVVLVGHSFGGMSIALAMDKFPQKIAVGVFVAAFIPCGGKTSLLIGPKFLSTKFYQLCSSEDLELARTLMRPGSLFPEDLSQANNFSREGYGSVPCAYTVCNEDLAIPLEYQQWMIQNAEIDKVWEIKGADHAAMLSKPQELALSLLEIADKHA